MGKSIMEEISELPPEEQEAILAEYDPEDLMWDWRMWGRPEQIAPEGDWSVWLYLAGRGCVAGETEIFDSITGDTRTIAEWAERGESISVYTPFGYEVTDGAPFIKGTDHLWRVEFSSGTSILVTAQHLFLREGNWVPLADITPGDTVAAMEPDLREHGPYSVAKPFIPLVGDAAHRANLAAIAEHEAMTMVEGRSLRSQYADVSRHDPTTTVVRITHARHDSFYDLTVPIAGAYFAHGVLNHNSGKTRSAAEWIREIGMSTKDGPQRIALVARTAGDVRDVVVEGESGLLNVHAPSERPKYEPSKRKITWANGNTATTFTADEPDSLRGPQFRLDVATPILTTEGWKTMGTVEVGDVIYGENGQETAITAVHPIALAEDTYRVTFDDRSEILADGKHLWITITTNDMQNIKFRHGPRFIPDNWATWESHGMSSKKVPIKTRNTEELRDSLINVSGGLNHRIPATKTIERPEVDLPIDPWLFGLMLGDASTKSPTALACHPDDQAWTIKQIESLGLEAHERGDGHIYVPGVREPWRGMDVHSGKHIPEMYLTASANQRLELLRGLIDSDGGVEPNGSVRFVNTNRDLIDGVAELAASLGMVPIIYTIGHRERKGNVCLPAWYVHIRANQHIARMPRKIEKMRIEYGLRARCRSIRSIEPAEPVMMRCISVDNPSKLFLAGKSLISTRNSASWGDEVAAWRQTPDAAGMTAFDNLRVATRLGSRPRLFVTTTPKRVPLLHKLLEDHENDPKGIVVSRGSTFDNMSNLSAGYLDTMQGIYGGTALGAQELLGEMLDAQDGAMWNEELIDKYRDANHKNTMPPLRVVAVDPSVAENPKDECGIVVVGSTAERELFRRHAWVLEDATVLGAPDVWARRVVDMARQYRCPVVAEVNQGGALVAAAIHNIDPNIVVHEVHSKQGKSLRAEPVVMTYQQGRVHHRGYLGALESQMNTWIPGDGGKSPDRIDALVHGLTALLIRPPKGLNAGTVQARTSAAQKLGLTRRVTRPTRR